MARNNKKADEAETTETVSAPPPPPTKEPGPKTPRYAWIGPPGPAIRFPGMNLVFRPAKITDNQVTALLQRHPHLSRYFSDAQAEE